MYYNLSILQDLLERWYIMIAPSDRGYAGEKGDSSACKKAQKRIMYMLRTLYSFLRIIPTYQVIKQGILTFPASSNHSHLRENFNFAFIIWAYHYLVFVMHFLLGYL